MDVNSDDRFLTALSEGRDLTQGEDPLASLLLDFREDVTRPAEQSPIMFQTSRPRAARMREYIRVAFVGAAAASVLVTVSGMALNRVPETSPMWGLASQVFPQKVKQKELSDALVGINQELVSGNVEEAVQLAAEAQASIRGVDIHAPVPTYVPESHPQVAPKPGLWGGLPTSPDIASTAALKPALPAPTRDDIKEPASASASASSSQESTVFEDNFQNSQGALSGQTSAKSLSGEDTGTASRGTRSEGSSQRDDSASATTSPEAEPFSVDTQAFAEPSASVAPITQVREDANEETQKPLLPIP